MTSEEQIMYRLRNPRIIEHVDIATIHIEGVNYKDHPDYVDAYVAEASWLNGDELSDDDLEWLTNDYTDIVHDEIIRYWL